MVSASKPLYIRLLIIIATLLALGCYYFFDPLQVTWMPKCPFQELTCLECPACGNQRALHALLHGNFGKAFSYNPFFILSLPYLLLLCISAGSKKGRMKQIKEMAQNRKVVNVYLIAICATRNSPELHSIATCNLCSARLL